MTDVTEAAGRLKLVATHEDRERVYGHRPEYSEGEPQHLDWEWQFEQYVTDLGDVADAYLRETDTRLVDELFAKSVATERDSGMAAKQFRVGSLNLFFWSFGGCRLEIRGSIEVSNPTIGQFYTTMRLMGVKVKGE